MCVVLADTLPQASGDGAACAQRREGPWCTLLQEEELMSALQVTADLSRRANIPVSIPRPLASASDSRSKLPLGVDVKRKAKAASIAKHWDGLRKMASLLMEKCGFTAYSKTATKTWRKHQPLSLILLPLLFFVFILTLAGLALHYYMPVGRGIRTSSQQLNHRQPVQAAPLPPRPPSSYHLPGLTSRVLSPYRWPEKPVITEEKKSPRGSCSDLGTLLGGGVSLRIPDSWVSPRASSSDQKYTDKTQGRVCFSGGNCEGWGAMPGFGRQQTFVPGSPDSPWSGGKGGIPSDIGSDDDNHCATKTEPGPARHHGMAVQSQIDRHGHLCPFINSAVPVKYCVHGSFLKDPTGTFDVTICNDIGNEVFSMYTRPNPAEGVRRDEARQIFFSWFGKDPDKGHAPLARLARLETGKSLLTEELALQAGGVWGIYDMNNTLFAQLNPACDDPRKWHVLHVIGASSDNFSTQKMYTLSKIPVLPTFSEDMENIPFVDNKSVRVSVLHPNHNGVPDELAIHILPRSDMVLALLSMFGTMILQRVSAEAVNRFAEKHMDDASSCAD